MRSCFHHICWTHTISKQRHHLISLPVGVAPFIGYGAYSYGHYGSGCGWLWRGYCLAGLPILLIG
jgi:hypothetical protein